jgi:DNA-directed RNA polymerase subunit omega
MELPQNVDSKFRFILVAAKRARQLQAGAKPLIQTPTKKVTRVAQLEVEAGLVPFEVLVPASNNNDAGKKQKAAK